MCAIIDANVVAQAFGDALTPAGKAFRKRVDKGKLQLVVGGKLLDELDSHGKFRRWRAAAIQYGKIHTVEREIVEPRTDRLRASGNCVSDDEHIVALAQVSGARLLFSNDGPLHNDFKSKPLIDGPRGKIYSTRNTTEFTRQHRQLLNDPALCNLTT